MLHSLNPSIELTMTQLLMTALAVLGQADWATLFEVAEVSADTAGYLELTTHPNISHQQDVLVLDPKAAATLLNALEANNFLHFRQLHERALNVLGQHLSAGRQTQESCFQAVFIRLAERLLNQSPHALAELVASLRPIPGLNQTVDYLDLFDAIALRDLEQYGAALAHLNRLLEKGEIANDVRGRVLNARAITHFWQGRLQSALDDYQAALQIWEATGNQVQAGLVNLNIAVAAYELHDYARAEVHLDAAEMLFAATQSLTWLPSVFNERGLIYRDQGRWDEAMACFARSLQQRRAEGALQRVGVILNNVGEVLLLQGKVEEARQAFLESLENMTVDNVRIDALINLGLLHQFLGELGRAQDFYEQALTTAQRIERHDILPSIHYRVADLARQQEQPEIALRHLFSGIEQIEATRTPLSDQAVKISLLGRWQQLYEAAVLLLVDQQRFSEALTLVERARSRALFELIGTTALTTEQPFKAAMIVDQLPPTMVLIEFFATGLPGSHAGLIAQLPADAMGLRSLLLPAERLLLFCVCDGAIHCYDLPLRLSQIEAQYFQRGDGRLRGIVPLPGQPLRPMRRWLDLGTAFFEPLHPHLLGKGQLVFVPHALLHYLPLHALTDLEKLTQVAITSVSYAPSASIFLAKLAQARTVSAPATAHSVPHRLAIGVDAGGLTHAEAEARWVANQLGGELLTGDRATPTAVLKALTNSDLIHISCHALFRQRRPMESALLVAGGEVSAADLLATVKLTAKLVTLSACDTGLNRLDPGDEPLGLTRAVLGCGAQSLLATLWPVHEIPTRLLMEKFYNEWLDGKGKASALVAAQRWLTRLTMAELRQRLGDFALLYAALLENQNSMLKNGMGNSGFDMSSAEHFPNNRTIEEQITATLALFQQMLPGDQPFDHPYYWAAFVLIGDPS